MAQLGPFSFEHPPEKTTVSETADAKPSWHLNYEDFLFEFVGKRKDRRERLGRSKFGEVYAATLS